MSERPILVTGADGMLGRALQERLTLPDGPVADILWTDVPELDITDEAAARRIIERERPGVIVNCAAMTDVDGCEGRREEAFRVNGHGVAGLAGAANAADSLLVQISTDFIFSGDAARPYREDDQPGPLSVYGESKLAGETAARQAARHLIVRTSWLYGPGGRNFVEAICRHAAAGTPLRVVGDQVGCPTYTRDLAEALLRLLNVEARGTFHACGREAVSWFAFAQAIVNLWRPSTAVEEIAFTELNRPARRPAFSVLDCAKLLEVANYRLPGVSQSLPKYLKELEDELPEEP